MLKEAYEFEETRVLIDQYPALRQQHGGFDPCSRQPVQVRPAVVATGHRHQRMEQSYRLNQRASLPD